MVIGIVLFISFLLIFFFRDQISQFKEILKAKVRNTLKPMFFKVENEHAVSENSGNSLLEMNTGTLLKIRPKTHAANNWAALSRVVNGKNATKRMQR